MCNFTLLDFKYTEAEKHIHNGYANFFTIYA